MDPYAAGRRQRIQAASIQLMVLAASTRAGSWYEDRNPPRKNPVARKASTKTPMAMISICPNLVPGLPGRPRTFRAMTRMVPTATRGKAAGSRDRRLGFIHKCDELKIPSLRSRQASPMPVEWRFQPFLREMAAGLRNVERSRSTSSRKWHWLRWSLTSPTASMNA